MWELFEVKSKEEADLIISALENYQDSGNDMRGSDNPEKIEEAKMIEDLVERLS